MKWVCTFLLALLLTEGAHAQTAATDAAARCPAGLAEAHWEAFSTPDLLFCKAVTTGGEEIFALTISRETPFRPLRIRRAEVGTLAGAALQWYSGDPALGEFVRELVLDTADGRKAHIFLRAPDSASMTLRQRMVEMLDLQRAPDDE